MSTNNQILKARDVSQMLGVGLSTVYRAVENGQLPVVRIGKALRFRREAIERFCAAQEAQVLGEDVPVGSAS
jgi:excisionase family DNA binding protein